MRGLYSLVVEPAVDERVVHGVAHGEPVDAEEDCLHVFVIIQPWILQETENKNSSDYA